MKTFDAIVIGSGQGGTPLAKKLAEAGYNTALIERRWVGGTCVNDGCTPTKAMIASAKMAHQVAKSTELGITTSRPEVNIQAVIERQQRIVTSFRNSSETKLVASKNLSLIYGEASFSGPKKLKIKMSDGKVNEIEGNLVFIDTGTRPNIPQIDGLDTVPYLTSTTILSLKDLPEHLLIVGSGYVGLEFGQMYRRFGSKVTMLERSERILKKEDDDIASEVSQVFAEENIDIKLNSKAVKFKKPSQGIEVEVEQNGEQQTISCSH
ncbi:MAG: FAD-dependent oxidoreductase, partial [Bacteroidota bacterium]